MYLYALSIFGTIKLFQKQHEAGSSLIMLSQKDKPSQPFDYVKLRCFLHLLIYISHKKIYNQLLDS